MALNPELRALKALVMAEIRLYDGLSATPRLVYRPPTPIVRSLVGPRFSCAHGVMLCDVCTKCGRTEVEDLLPYWIEMQSMLKELLATLEKAGMLG